MMAPAVAAIAHIVDSICSHPARGACTDAERRACVALHDDLRARGEEAWVETFWLRPQWAASLLLHALLGVAASLAAVGAPVPALAVAGVATVSYALEPNGLRRLFYRRASQIVLVEPREPEAITLLIVAGVDAPRRGVMFHDRLRRIGARLWPEPRWWVVLVLAGVAAAAAARVAGAEGPLLGALQFVPTIVLLLAATAALDVVLSSASAGAGEAAGAAVALALHEELGRTPLERLSPSLALAGAHPLALRAHLRRERPEPARMVVLEIGPCADGTPVWRTHHHQLEAACEWTAAELPELEARRLPGGPRLRGLPSLHVEAVGPRDIPSRITPDRVDEHATAATLRFCLAAVEVLDADLGVQPDAA